MKTKSRRFGLAGLGGLTAAIVSILHCAQGHSLAGGVWLCAALLWFILGEVER